MEVKTVNELNIHASRAVFLKMDESSQPGCVTKLGSFVEYFAGFMSRLKLNLCLNLKSKVLHFRVLLLSISCVFVIQVECRARIENLRIVLFVEIRLWRFGVFIPVERVVISPVVSTVDCTLGIFAGEELDKNVVVHIPFVLLSLSIVVWVSSGIAVIIEMHPLSVRIDRCHQI